MIAQKAAHLKDTNGNYCPVMLSDSLQKQATVADTLCHRVTDGTI